MLNREIPLFTAWELIASVDAHYSHYPIPQTPNFQHHNH